MKEKIIFFGAGPYVKNILDILSQKFDIVLNVSKLDKETVEKIKETNVKLAVLASFGQIITQEVLDLFPLGIINIHPSLLPKYRGATPVQAAILNGDHTTGVSLMKLDAELDHGPILAQVEADIEPGDNSESLYHKLFKLGTEKLVEILPQYIEGNLKPTEQDDSKATFTARALTRDSGLIDLAIPPTPDEIRRMVHAYYPWPGVWFKAKLNGAEKIIKLLPNKMIQVEGKNAKNPKDFENGYPEGKDILNKLGLS